MTELAAKQVCFTRYLAILLSKFSDLDITLGESWRSRETCEIYAKEGKGIASSCHTIRLAQDLNILKDGVLSNDKRDYETLGIFWKELPLLYPTELHVITCWGGDFVSIEDIYHFSIQHNNVK